MPSPTAAAGIFWVMARATVLMSLLGVNAPEGGTQNLVGFLVEHELGNALRPAHNLGAGHNRQVSDF